MSAALLLACLALAGCNTIDRVTGQTDNTVLPGQREDAIPGKAQFPEPGSGQPTATTSTVGGAGTGTQQKAAPEAKCDTSDPECQVTGEDIYSDPQ